MATSLRSLRFTAPHGSRTAGATLGERAALHPTCEEHDLAEARATAAHA